KTTTEQDGSVVTDGTVSKEDAEKASDNFSGDWSKPEEAGYPPFWLKYGPKDLEKKDLSNLELFGCFTDGTSLKDILYNPKFTYYEVTLGYASGIETEDLPGTLEANTETYGYGRAGEICLYEEKDGNYIYVEIYNLSEEQLSVMDIIERNEFNVGELGQLKECNTGRTALGMSYEVFDISKCVELGELLGRPDKIYHGFKTIMLTDRDGSEESFEETVSLGGGTIMYDMLYQMPKGKLFVGLTESHVDEDYASYAEEQAGVLVEYCSCEELYTYLRDETNSGAIVQEDWEYNFE
ncbi:MAG: hypothetical protein ACI4GW_03845, partial [Lachnospiraceae bacterium]